MSLRGSSGSVSGSNSYILLTLLTHLSRKLIPNTYSPPDNRLPLPVLPWGSPEPSRPDFPPPLSPLFSLDSSRVESERESCRFILILLPLLTFLQQMLKRYPLPYQWRPTRTIYVGEALDYLTTLPVAQPFTFYCVLHKSCGTASLDLITEPKTLTLRVF